MWTAGTSDVQSPDGDWHPNHVTEVNLGMALIGLVLSSTLFGVTVMQLLAYYSRFPNDRIILRVLVRQPMSTSTVLKSRLLTEVNYSGYCRWVMPHLTLERSRSSNYHETTEF